MTDLKHILITGGTISRVGGPVMSSYYRSRKPPSRGAISAHVESCLKLGLGEWFEV